MTRRSLAREAEVEFLVRIDVRLPPDMPLEQRSAILTADRVVADRLKAAGVVYRIWRVPGRFGSIGIWHAADASELHQHLLSFPLFPWLDCDVTALAAHPLEATPEGS
jgi:muconolactone D-isomerase